jgi:transposase
VNPGFAIVLVLFRCSDPWQRPFLRGKHLSSWVGACPGDEESAGVNYSHRSPQGNRHMRRLLNQVANAAVKVKGSIFEIGYHRSVPAWDTTKPSGPLPIDSVG